MPTQSSRVPEEILEEPVSFTVINNFGIFGKPNAIVRPLRRREPFEGSNNHNNNNENIIVESSNHSQQLTKFSSKTQSLDYTTKELDLNLKKLQKEKLTKNGSLPIIQQKRPIFITTVPKGVFLQPIKDIPIIQRRVYAYMSHPRILHNFNNNNNNNNITNNNNNNYDVDINKEGQLTSRLVNGFGAIASGVAGFKLGRYREHSQSQTYQNVMYDKRVVRGSNYSTTHITSWNPYFAYAGLLSGKGEGDCCTKESEAQRRQLLRKKCMSRNQRGIIGTPPPVKGRKHERVQTEKYLEELFARPPEMDVSCQTDLFLHRPPSPPFIPSKTGCDASTEILDGELFDFDTEVQTILETLIGKSVEQGLVEVIHEEELSEMRAQKQRYLAIRETELAELKRLEEQEKRLQAEKERRLHQDGIAKELDREMQQRVTAAKLLQGHIANLLPGVLSNIEPLTQAENREELEKHLGPWLAQEVAEEVGQMIDSRDLLEEIVREILRERAEIYRAMMNSESGTSVNIEEEATGEEEEELGFEDDLSESGKDL